MLKYVAVAGLAAILLGFALTNAGSPPAVERETPTIVAGEHPEATVVAHADGTREITVRHRFASSVSRASLVYDRQGEPVVAATNTDCHQALSTPGEDGMAATVAVSARVPGGAESLRLVVEDETGTRIYPSTSWREVP